MKKKLSLIFLISIFINSYSFEINIEGLESLGLADEIIPENTGKKEEKKTDFDLNFNKENLNFYGNFNVEIAFYSYDSSSMNYKLKEDKNLIEENAYQNSLELNFNASYKYEQFEMQLKTFSQYINDDNSEFNFYEGYVTYSQDYNFYTQVGKSALYWGKGYAFNPVGVINPVKDPDDPETSGEGKNLINLEYTKSYMDKFTDVFTGNLVFIFENDDTDNGFGNTANIGTAAKAYFLMFNSDIDFILYNKNDQNSVGFDFSTNILPELELHGEYIYEKNSKQKVVDADGDLSTDTVNTSSYLVGLKYLFKTGTNITLEYYYNGTGISEESYSNIYNNYEESYVNTYSVYKQLGKYSMQKYFYTKLSHPEPFELIYTNISLTNIMNIIDNSSSTKLNLSYSPYNNIKLYVEIAYLNGKISSEYGDKSNINLKIGGTLNF